MVLVANDGESKITLNDCIQYTGILAGILVLMLLFDKVKAKAKQMLKREMAEPKPN